MLKNGLLVGFSALSAASILSSCNEAAPEPKESEQITAAKISAQRAEAKAVSQPMSDDGKMSETDRLMLEEAEKACFTPGGEGYVQFFDAFARSRAVRQKYSAAKIKYVVTDRGGRRLEQSVDAAGYDNFPVVIVDYYRKPAFPSRSGEREEYVEMQFNQSQSGHFSAGWTRVTYDGKSEGGDDLGNPVGLDGQPYDPMRQTDGQLLFNSVGGCWQLVADIRNEDSLPPKQQ